MPQGARKLTGWALAGLGLGAIVVLSGCIKHSGGTWLFDSADTPEGWPEMTPVGEVQVKEYPVYRAATVYAEDLSRSGMSPMFNALFRHISEQDIAMTAPVDMGYRRSSSSEGMESMAFMYQSVEIGRTGEDGPVQIEDRGAQTYATVGTRGGYTAARFEKGLDQVEAWLHENQAWQASGEPRFLGYNGPFVPFFWRYGEVQVPVSRAR